VLESACDWCDDRGDFPRSLSLLVKIDRIEPAGGVCERMAKTLHRLDRDSEAIATLMRGVSLLGDADEVDPATLYQVAACYCIDDHRFTDALACIQLSDASPTPRVWQLMARCYEAMGKLEDAEQCMRQQATNSPEDMVDYYLWAKRLGRKDTAGVRQKALAAIGPHNDSIFPSVCMSLAEDQEHKALELLRSFPDALGDAFGSAQLLILATKHSDKDLAKHAAESLSDPFGLALKSLASAKDIGTAAREFDEWVHRQLDDENAVDWYSLAGRYLLAAGHVEQGKTFLIKAIRCSAREQPNYFLAWRELQKLGEDPRQLMSVSTSQP
jgi:tetratricopeptide (TPR) repeat protein